MAKVQGSFASVVRGVSQQHPADRIEGQHGEQVNMISDPVRGIVRRNGSVLRDARYDPVSGPIADAQADSYSFRSFSFTAAGVNYDMVYRTRPIGNGVVTGEPADLADLGPNHLLGVHVFNKTPNSSGGWIDVTSDVVDTVLVNYVIGGFSAVTNLGRYVLLAGNAQPPTQTAADNWGTNPNASLSVFWVRAGGYARTYTVKARRASDQVEYTANYTTKSAVYPGTLDISNIPSITPNLSFGEGAFGITSSHTFTAPVTGVALTVDSTSENAYEQIAETPGGLFTIYQTVSGAAQLGKYIRVRVVSQVGSTITVDVVEVGGGPWDTIGGTNDARWYPHGENTSYTTQVNDATAAYNQAVNQWAADAAADILPSNIATQLSAALALAGFADWTVTGSHAFNDDCDLVEASDSADGDFIIGLSNQTVAADEVTPIHKVGKIIRVSPRGNEDGAYYLQAFPKNPDNSATYQDVVWREAAGTVQEITNLFLIGTVENNIMYFASTPERLRDLVLAQEAVVLDLPDYEVSKAGDLESNTPPEFTKQAITGLFVFQDRLGIASGSTITLSRSGDYFNFYRTTVLTLPDDDVISGYALGSEGDFIRKACLYDRNLILFGDKAIYNISGRVPQTPTTFNIAVQLNVENTSLAQPVGAGQNVSFLKEDTQLASTRMLQVKAGLFQDSPVVDDASKQLRDYINGTPAEMVSLVSPDMVFVRTEFFLKTQGGFPRARPWGLYVYSYLDQPDGQRIVDSWSAWEWSSTLGTPVGMTATTGGDGIMLYTLAWGTNEAGEATRGLLALSFSARPDPTGLPYLDGMTLGDQSETSGLWTPQAQPQVTNVVYTAYGAGYSYSATPDGDDAVRFSGLTHPHYTVGDGPPENTDPLRWQGLQGWYSDAVTEFGEDQEDNLWTGLAFPAFVDVTNPFVRDRDGKPVAHGRLTLTRLKVTNTRTAGFAASFIDYEGQAVTGVSGGTYSRITYDNNVWVGRDTRHVQVRLSANLWYPLTIAGIDWQGQWFSNSRRV